MQPLSRLFAILHNVSGLILLLFSGWFIAACAIAGSDFANVNFNYLLPAVFIRALALTRIATGYAQMWTGHRALLTHVKSLRLTLFSRLKDKLLRRRAEGTEALAKHSESIASLNMAWTAHNLGALFMVVTATTAIAAWLPKLLWLWAIFCASIAVVFALGFQQVRISVKAIFAEKTAFRHDSEHHLTSASLWHLRDDVKHSDMQNVLGKILNQKGIGERMLWWTQVVALVGLMVLLSIGQYQGQAVLLVFILLLLSAKDWLGQMMRSQTAFADYRESHNTFETLPTQDIESAKTFPDKINTLTLRDFSVENRPVPAIDLTLKSSEILLLKGSSGAGKSSLLKAIAGLLPQTGEKIVNGDTVGQGFIQTWHYADQSPVLLSASLATNLRLAKPDASEAELRDALQFADLAHLDNLTEWLGEQGRQLSGGELKRLNLARAYLFDATLYLFDEPFEGLDEVKQNIVAERINELSSRAPVIVASHIVPKSLSVVKEVNLAVS